MDPGSQQPPPQPHPPPAAAPAASPSPGGLLPPHLVSVLSSWPQLSALPLDHPALLVRSGLLARLQEMAREITQHLQLMQAQRRAASRLLTPEQAAAEAAGQLTPQQMADAHLYSQLHALLSQVQVKEREVENALQRASAPSTPAAFGEPDAEPGQQQQQQGQQRQASNVDMRPDGPAAAAARNANMQQINAAHAVAQSLTQQQQQQQQQHFYQQQQQQQQHSQPQQQFQQHNNANSAVAAAASSSSSSSKLQQQQSASLPATAAASSSAPAAAAASSAGPAVPAGFTWILPVDRRKLPGARYQKIRTLRKTLFGKVSLYFDTTTQQRVAIKLSNKELLIEGKTTTGNQVAENPLEELRFLRILSRRNEADAAGGVAAPQTIIHPGQNHVLQLLDECEDETDLWTVLEFCGKGEFFDIVCAANRFDEAKARLYFIQLAQGVAYLHAHLICHLDLSLENMLMDDQDVCKICDFGVARMMTLDHNRHLVAYPGINKNNPGKIGYMAPEMFAGHSFYGHLCDVWAMGIILFISLTGVPPYQLPAVSDQRFKLIYEGNLHKLLAAWQMTNIMSAAAKDILSRMLCPPERRMNIQQILAHPWVTGAPM